MKIILEVFWRGQMISEHEDVLRPDYIYATQPTKRGYVHHATWAILKDLEVKVEIKGDP